MVRAAAGVWMLGMAVLTAACGSGSASSGGAGGKSESTGNSVSSSFHCCLNSDTYECPSDAALQKCGGGDPGACLAGCSGADPTCFEKCMTMVASPDPSDCTAVNESAATWCKSSSTGSSSGGGCDGQSCQFSSDCPNNQNCNSATGHCFENTADCAGHDCAFDSDCPNGQSCNSATMTCFNQ
jgi:hypothetical protein